MSSNVSVCNSALSKLGADRIVSLTDNSGNARACNAAYERVRDRLLRRHPWNFAIRRAQLAASSTPPTFTRSARYPLPADFLRLLPPDPEENLNSLDWQIENGAIVTNDGAPLNVRYVARITDPNEMDSLFLELWATDLAFDICEEVTGSNAKKESLRLDSKQLVAEARKVNAFENVAGAPPTDVFLTARL